MTCLRAAIVVLAAGASRRLGRPKQALELAGRSLLARTLDAVMMVPVSTRVLVLGGAHVPADAALDGLSLVHNAHAGEGMASSLRLGLQTAREIDPRLDAVLFTVCDQPFLAAPLLHELLRALEDGWSMSAALYDDVLGVPAAFRAEHFPALARLRGDEGARRVLRLDPTRVHAVPFPRGDIDIDSLADLACAQAP